MTHRSPAIRSPRAARRRLVFTAGALSLAVLALAACSQSEAVFPDRDRVTGRRVYKDPSQPDTTPGLLGPGGLNILGGADKEAEPGAGGVGVNSYLWRAALDTIAFMPLTSADPFGGVVISDWYAPPETPDERFKVNVYILAKALRADGVKVSVFRQERTRAGSWQDTAVAPQVATDMENAILTRARQLRLAVLTD